MNPRLEKLERLIDEAHKPMYLPWREKRTRDIWECVEAILKERELTSAEDQLVDKAVEYIGEADHQGEITPGQAYIILDFVLYVLCSDDMTN